jgi:hypothetical protein
MTPLQKLLLLRSDFRRRFVFSSDYFLFNLHSHYFQSISTKYSITNKYEKYIKKTQNQSILLTQNFCFLRTNHSELFAVLIAASDVPDFIVDLFPGKSEICAIRIQPHVRRTICQWHTVRFVQRSENPNVSL